jgi:hypothetical protein
MSDGGDVKKHKPDRVHELPADMQGDIMALRKLPTTCAATLPRFTGYCVSARSPTFVSARIGDFGAEIEAWIEARAVKPTEDAPSKPDGRRRRRKK